MISTNLQGIAELVVRQAQRQGFVVPREVRALLRSSALSESLWKEVLEVARSSLVCRHGRYYYTPPVSDRVRAQQSHQRNIQMAIMELMRHHRETVGRVERRGEDRIDFIHPVKIVMGDGQQITMLSRDISTTGIRLLGTRRLLGQKVQLVIDQGAEVPIWSFVVRILWTCAIGDDLVENGGSFLDATILPAGSAAP